MRAVYPPEMMQKAAEEARAENESERLLEAAAKSREAVFKGWAGSVDFKAHLLEGWMKEEEANALAELEACGEAEVVEKRSAWRAVKRLRQKLTDEVMGAGAARL